MEVGLEDASFKPYTQTTQRMNLQRSNIRELSGVERVKVETVLTFVCFVLIYVLEVWVRVKTNIHLSNIKFRKGRCCQQLTLGNDTEFLVCVCVCAAQI